MAIASLALGLLSPIGAPSGLPLAASAAAESIDQEDVLQKQADLARADTNAGESPDRLVLVYTSPTAVDDGVRQQVRRRLNGQLLQASRGLQRDVVRVPNGSAAAAAQVARTLAGVHDAYVDRVAHVHLLVNDPMLPSQWSLTMIRAPIAWDSSLGQGAIVGVLDCGIHGSHPDLVGKVVTERNFTTTASVDDLCNHGTHVAGTIAADTNNGLGIAAVAPNARVLNAKVLDDTGSGFFSDIDRGIQWAADNGAQVINMSLGAEIPCPSGTQTAVNYAWSKGAVLVASAGNAASSTGAGTPANCQNVIAVAATDAADLKPGWSNSGPNVQIAAPGDAILSTINPDINAGMQYASMSGTSMASPHAAGVLALLFSTSYGSSPAAMRDRLLATADPIPGTGTLWARGRINAAAAVAGSGGTPTSTPTVGATNWSQQTLTFDDLANPNRSFGGQYPAGVIDWGSGQWYLAAPWGQFSTQSISFDGPSRTSASFTFLTTGRLDRLQAYNGGTVVSTVSLACSGQPTVTTSVAVGQLVTVVTNWTSACSGVSVSSSNGWDTNLDNVGISTSSAGTSGATATPTPSPTATQTATATQTRTAAPTHTATPTQTATATATATRTPTSATAMPTPTATATPIGGTRTVTFDDLSSPNRVLNGQYPTGLIDWGSNGAWYLAAPWGLFTTNSVSFSSAAITTASFSFVTPHRLLRLDAYNGGSTAATLTLACSGQPTVTSTLAPNQLATVTTNWTAACTTVTVTSTNSWFINLDNLVIN